MTHKIARTPQSRHDLIEIWNYIADDNERAADKILSRIEDILRMLSENPNAGRIRPELAPALPSFPLTNYILFYRPIEAGIELVRVLSSRLDIQPDDFI
jgi:toxin ParE1/3/4